MHRHQRSAHGESYSDFKMRATILLTVLATFLYVASAIPSGKMSCSIMEAIACNDEITAAMNDCGHITDINASSPASMTSSVPAIVENAFVMFSHSFAQRCNKIFISAIKLFQDYNKLLHHIKIKEMYVGTKKKKMFVGKKKKKKKKKKS